MGRGRPKGIPKTGGRKPGSPNKENKLLRDMILGALDDRGGQEWLARQADENPTAFMQLIAKVLPTQITGGGGGPLVGEWTVRIVRS